MAARKRLGFGLPGDEPRLGLMLAVKTLNVLVV